MPTFSGPIKQKAAYGDPNVNTFAVEAAGTTTFNANVNMRDVMVYAKLITAASVSAASSAATTTLVPRGYLNVLVSGVRVAIPYYNTKS